MPRTALSQIVKSALLRPGERSFWSLCVLAMVLCLSLVPKRKSLFLLLALPLFGACDVVFALLGVLIIGPAYPGIPQPPPVATVCPLPAREPRALVAVPEDLHVDVPATNCAVGDKPGLHRLNRDELSLSLHDLLGIDVDAALFPPDDQGQGFDTDALALNVSPLLVERLEEVTRNAVTQALRRVGDVPEKTISEAESLRRDGIVEDVFVAVTGGEIETLLSAPVPGHYMIRVRAAARLIDAEPARMAVYLDNNRVLISDVDVDVDEAKIFEVQVRISPTSEDKASFQPVHRVKVVMENSKEIDGQQRTLLIDLLEIEGPFDAEARGPATLSRSLLLPCAPKDEELDADCGEQALLLLAARAWRTPLLADDVTRLRALWQEQLETGDDVETVFATSAAAVLLSPRFLNRIELDDALDTQVRLLSAHELASRLSYFLWSTMPDQRLFELAESDALLDERVLLAEAERLLDDPRAAAVVERFFAQYLGLVALQGAHPDPERFGDFDEDLRLSMLCETELLVDRLLRERKVATELLTSTTTSVNHRLAGHYGLPPPQGEGYAEVDVEALGRSGVLTQGSVLTMTSQPTRTSPTRRGKWALDRLLCITPEPPPPGVEGLSESAPGEEPASVRELMEVHRQDPLCASCHSVIDPLGLPMEHFDAVGRFRGSDGRFAIDDSALYFGIDDDVVAGPRSLAQRMANDDLFTRCLAERALSYGTGRGAQSDGVDACAVDELWQRFVDGGAVLSDLLVEVVRSPSFRLRTPTRGAQLDLDIGATR